MSPGARMRPSARKTGRPRVLSTYDSRALPSRSRWPARGGMLRDAGAAISGVEASAADAAAAAAAAAPTSRRDSRTRCAASAAAVRAAAAEAARPAASTTSPLLLRAPCSKQLLVPGRKDMPKRSRNAACEAWRCLRRSGCCDCCC
eukprot:295242-Chlamydomonas_euryale.AAC.6